jgi:serine/threonine protein kinase
MKGLLSAIEHMHAENIIHRDLKPENILMGDSVDLSSVKLADFGLSHRFGDTKMIKEHCGTCIFMAPEQLL